MARPPSPDSGSIFVPSSDIDYGRHGTPENYPDTTSNLPQEVKNVVACLSYLRWRCILTSESMRGNMDNEVIHMLRRATEAPRLRHLAIKWKKSGLNPDTTANLGIMRADLHKAFDSGAFVLIPTAQVLLEMLEYANAAAPPRAFDEAFQLNDNEFWTYAFVPLTFNKERSIFIKNIDYSKAAEHEDWDKFADKPGYTECNQLYEKERKSLRDIKSHMHPFYVVYNAGEKIGKLEGGALQELLVREPDVQYVFRIYRRWMRGWGEGTSQHEEGDAVTDLAGTDDEHELGTVAEVDHESDREFVATENEELEEAQVENEEVNLDMSCSESEAPENEEQKEGIAIREPPASTVTSDTRSTGTSTISSTRRDVLAPKSAATAPATFTLSGTRSASRPIGSTKTIIGTSLEVRPQQHRDSRLPRNITFLRPANSTPKPFDSAATGQDNAQTRSKGPTRIYISDVDVHRELGLARRPELHSHRSYPNPRRNNTSFTLPSTSSNKPSSSKVNQSRSGIDTKFYSLIEPRVSKDKVAKRLQELQDATLENQRKALQRAPPTRIPRSSISEPGPRAKILDDGNGGASDAAQTQVSVRTPPPSRTPVRHTVSEFGGSSVPDPAASGSRLTTVTQTLTRSPRSPPSQSSQSPTKKRKQYSTPPKPWK
ncbi:hypothetical protein VNI00_004269 [Paramarasmius palmivorus]|uniref:Uncharacterized protein n=1 Tax=Paramarasmius palmivorus TaxID=297713 RepID=A0AAW0DN08_9AGAR